MNPIEKHLFSLHEISIYLSLSHKTLYIWAEEGKIPAYKLGRIWRFDKNEIDNFVRNNSNIQNGSSHQQNGNVPKGH